MPSASSSRQLLNEEEDKLFRSLSRIYHNIKRDMNLQLTAGRVTWYDIQRIYRRQADDAIRSAVTSTYEISARKTVEKDIRIPFFLTEQDMTEIRHLTKRYTDWFWVGMEHEIVKKTAMAYDPRTFMRLDPSKFKLKDTFIGRMTESLHGEIAADAVISKARQVVVNDRRNSGFRTAAVEKKKKLPPHLIWVTSGLESVCEICQPLEARIFPLNDPKIRIMRPVLDTHPRCNCELVLANASEQEEIRTILDLYGDVYGAFI